MSEPEWTESRFGPGSGEQGVLQLAWWHGDPGHDVTHDVIVAEVTSEAVAGIPPPPPPAPPSESASNEPRRLALLLLFLRRVNALRNELRICFSDTQTGYSIYESGFGYAVVMRLLCNSVSVYTKLVNV